VNGNQRRNCAVIAFKQACQYIARHSEILISTNNNQACNVCSQYSGSEAKAVLLIRDEDPKELEVNGWIPLTKCKLSPKIAATTWQLQPTVLTAKEQHGWNDFSYQMEIFLVMSSG
jgi:hypothetical protein